MVVVCIGRRRTGKSTFANWYTAEHLWRRGERRVLVWVKQPEARYDGRELRSVGAALDHLGETRWVFRPPVRLAQVAELAKRLRVECPSRELVLVIDEVADAEVTAHRDGQPDWRDGRVTELLQTVRGVHLVCTTQRPANMPHSLRELADLYYVFAVSGAAAIQRLKNDGMPAHKLALVGRLKPHRCIPYHVLAE